MVLRKSIVALLCVFCMSLSFQTIHAQKQYLEITNLKTNRTTKIKEKKKITVFTKDLKVKGFLKIIDSQTILIKDTEIKISNIIMIRKKPILVTLLTFVVVPITTMIAIGINGLAHGSNASTDTIAIIGASAIALSTQIKKKYKSERYQFNIVYD